MAFVVTWKVIKAKKLSSASLRMTLINEMKAVEKEVKRDFQKTTATWEHKVEFDSAIGLKGPGPEMVVGTGDEIYRYVNDGTRAHAIEAGIYTGKSRAKALRFYSKHRAKTRPRTIASYRGYRGGKVLYRPRVWHPGTKARQFDKVLQKRWQPRFKRRMEQAMKRAAQRSGHGAR